MRKKYFIKKHKLPYITYIYICVTCNLCMYIIDFEGVLRLQINFNL